MNEMPVTPEAPKKNNTALIIGIVVAVLLCCCCIGAIVFYQFLGDPLIEALKTL